MNQYALEVFRCFFTGATSRSRNCACERMRGFCHAWYSPIVLNCAWSASGTPENGSGGFVSKPNSVM